jgi:hypothetical protein
LVSSTEFVADIPDYLGQGEDDFFATTQNYIDGVWTQLNVGESSFVPADMRHDLRYVP